MIQAIPYTGTPATLPLHQLRADLQIRMRNGFDESSLRELASTIKEVGVMQPIVVRPAGTNNAAGEPEFIVIAGERRMLAASLAGLTDVPVLMNDVDKAQADVMQAVENLQRVDLTAADTAEGVGKLLAHHKSAKAVARMLGKSPAWVSKYNSLTKLKPLIRDVMVSGATDDAELLLCLNQIARLPQDDKTQKALHKLIDGLESAKTTRESARKTLASLKAPGADDGQDGGEPDGEGGAETDPQSPKPETFGKLELAEEPARKLLAALEFAQDKKPSSRPGDALIESVRAFIAKTWG